MIPDLQNEFYETPETFTRYLFREMRDRRALPIAGQLFEPCVGSGAIVRASGVDGWQTNDIDPAWKADTQQDATWWGAWRPDTDWTVTNPPFSRAIEIASLALAASRIGVAMYLRISIHEVLKEGARRTFLAENPPTGIVFLPRFAYQRSPKTGKWTTDSATSCWVIWEKDVDCPRQWFAYAPESVLDELDAETPAYRARMDALMGFTGTEAERQAQRIARGKRENPRAA